MGKGKDKTPLPLKIIRNVFPVVEKVFPILAYRFFVKLFFTPLHYPLPEKERELVLRAELFSLEIDGKKIQGYKWGSGPIVLFVHGWAGRGTQFRKFIERFVHEGFQAVTFDGPAHGRSEGKRTEVIEFGKTLKKIFECLPQPPVAVITHSFGGAATLYAVMNGLPVSKLINIASPTIGDEIINTYLRAINGSWKSGNYFKDYIVRTYNKTFDEFTAMHFVRHLALPLDVLLFYDEDDVEVAPVHGEELVKIYPTARLIKTKGLGHTRILKDDQVIETSFRFVSSK